MSEQPLGNSAAAGQGQGQQIASPAGQGEQQQGQPQKYLTREEALSLITEQLGKASQSIADRTTARVQKVLDAAKAQGVAMTPQQAQAVIDATGEPATQPKQQQNQAATQSQGQSQAANAQPQQQNQTQSPPAYDPVTSKAVSILHDELGLKEVDPENLDEEAPEFKLLDFGTTDPEKFLASVREYGKAIAAKKAQEGDTARLPSLGNGKPSTTPAHANRPGREVLEEYYKSRT